MADSFNRTPQRGFVLPERKVELIGHFLDQNATTSHRWMVKLTLEELRIAKTREWGDRRRDWLLRKIEIRIKQLELAAELAVIDKNARKVIGRRGRLKLTPKQIEKRIEELFTRPDTPLNRSRIYDMTAMLKKRTAEALEEARVLAAGNPDGALFKHQAADLRRRIGDHVCADFTAVGDVCVLCRQKVGHDLADIE